MRSSDYLSSYSKIICRYGYNMSIRCNLRSIAVILVMTSSLFAAAGCHRDSEGGAAASVLTETKLVDQFGNHVSLALLKGKPLVVDLIYTSCKGECLMETAKLTNVAIRLGPDLGSKVTIVSISVDPEHDGPKQLLDYARQQGADKKGWYFLTGSPGNIDKALAGFKLSRQVMPDGSVVSFPALWPVRAPSQTWLVYCTQFSSR